MNFSRGKKCPLNHYKRKHKLLAYLLAFPRPLHFLGKLFLFWFWYYNGTSFDIILFFYFIIFFIGIFYLLGVLRFNKFLLFNKLFLCNFSCIKFFLNQFATALVTFSCMKFLNLSWLNATSLDKFQLQKISQFRLDSLQLHFTNLICVKSLNLTWLNAILLNKF